MKQYVLNNLIALDQVVNTVFGGSPDETLSARAWRTEQQGKLLGRVFRPLIDTLLWFDKDHCYKSYISEMNRYQFPISYRKG